jgi:hypothetical protein
MNDPDAAESLEEYVRLLERLCLRSGLSLRSLERRARTLGLPRWLPSSTVSDVFRDPRRLAGMTDRREFVESILRCCGVAEPAGWFAALDRLVVQERAPDAGDGGEPPGPRPANVRGTRPLLIAAALTVCAAGAGGVWWALAGHGPARSGGGAATACAAGLTDDETIDPALLKGTDAKRESPTLDFGYMHGSAWYEYRDGATYYWGRGRSETRTGGIRLLWRIGTGPWHACPAPITGPAPADDYARTPAIRKVINKADVVVRVCLWADYPRHDEKCTRPL